MVSRGCLLAAGWTRTPQTVLSFADQPSLKERAHITLVLRSSSVISGRSPRRPSHCVARAAGQQSVILTLVI